MFHPSNKKLPQLNIKIAQVNIEQVSTFNFLGITLDNHLTWKPHINSLSIKVSKNCGILHALKKFVPQHVLKLLYNSLVMSHLTYGISSWGYGNNMDRLSKIQKRAIRTITASKYNAHTDPIFKSQRILKIQDIRMLNEYKFYYKFTNNDLPSYHMGMIDRFNDTNRVHNTRTILLLQPIICRLTLAKNRLRYNVIKTMNNANTSIAAKSITLSYLGYARYIKNMILDSYEDKCNRRNCYICTQQSSQSSNT